MTSDQELLDRRVAELSWCPRDVLERAAAMGKRCTPQMALDMLDDIEDELQLAMIERGSTMIRRCLEDMDGLKCEACGADLSPGGYCTGKDCVFNQHLQRCRIAEPDESGCGKCNCGSLPPYGTDADCPKSPTGVHEPDPQSLRPSDGLAWVVDVNCVHCGRGGSASISPTEVDW